MARRKAGTYADWLEVGHVGDVRLYWIHYWEDPLGRVEAIRFFNGLSVLPVLYSCSSLPRFLVGMPAAEANEYLRKNPMRLKFRALEVGPDASIRDDDLRRLEYFPELEHVYLWNDAITDEGVRHLRHLRNIKKLNLYSTGITDGCLDTLRGLRTLRCLDIQGNPGLSRAACERLVRDLGGIESWLPYEPSPPSRWARFRGAVRRAFAPSRG